MTDDATDQALDGSAFASAQAGGVIDTFLAMPDTREKQAAKYDRIRALANDEGTQAMEMPAQYMFKGVPTFEGDEVDDPVRTVLGEMARHRISTFVVGVHENEHSRRAVREHPQHFAGMLDVDPNEGMGALRAIDAAVEEWGDSLKAVHCWGTGCIPQVPLDDKRMWPIYAKCIEIGRPIIVYAGVPGPRIPMAPQLPMLLDEVCWFWPELQVVVRHGADPWTELMVKLLLKYPGLHYSTSAFAPRYYPDDIVRFANTRGAEKVLYAGYYASGLTLDRIFSELPSVPFRDHVWPLFLRDNAARVFSIAPAAPPDPPS
ncbi:MAG TPA: amidohydrolase family protein [Acidimicrobiales bacterium]|nr:amidohydrolase family protein [Acidimicrobiales bacterium]